MIVGFLLRSLLRCGQLCLGLFLNRVAASKCRIFSELLKQAWRVGGWGALERYTIKYFVSATASICVRCVSSRCNHRAWSGIDLPANYQSDMLARDTFYPLSQRVCMCVCVCECGCCSLCNTYLFLADFYEIQIRRLKMRPPLSEAGSNCSLSQLAN